MLWSASTPLVLASKSPTRRAMFEAVGVPVEVIPADINERAIEDLEGATPDPGELALILSWKKANEVSFSLPARVVIAADQTLAIGSARLHKPKDRAEAREQLAMLRGKSHTLYSAVTVVQDGLVLFETLDNARLRMRNFSDAFLDCYLDAAGPAVTESVGGYQLEKLGSHLFDRIDGDHFTILGLPLLPLLDFLRRKSFIAA
jgi:septum formation protein